MAALNNVLAPKIDMATWPFPKYEKLQRQSIMDYNGGFE